MTEEYIHIRHERAVHGDGPLASTASLPQGRTIVAVEADDRVVALGGFHGFANKGRGILAERGHHTAGMKPAHAFVAEDLVPIHVTGLHLRDRRVAAIHHAHATTHAETALQEINAVPGRAAYAVKLLPLHMRLVDTALEHEIFDQTADGIVHKRRYDAGSQAEATPQPARDVVLAATLPDAEVACAGDALLAGIEAQHDLAERNEVVPHSIRRAKDEPCGGRCH